ncbi:MAG: hypothetical protein WD470_09370 [Rhodospirillaceae bacterium]
MNATAASLIDDLDRDGDADEIILGDRYRILPGSPLADLGAPGAKAYVARDLKNPGDVLFARVCDPKVFPRVEVMVQLKSLRDSAVLTPEDWGPITWPDTGQRLFSIVYRRPESGPLMPSLTATIQKIPSETLIKSFLNPALITLTLFDRRKITHRTIRPDNVFRATGKSGTLILGDCVSVPPSWGQSTIFETIESSMTPATARGKGTIADDIYALGATLLFLGLGHCPVAEMSERDLLQAKVEQGSFTALLRGEVAPAGLRESLRGMLSDDPLERWSLDDLMHWGSGSLRRSARPVREYKTDRSFRFRDREYRNLRSIAAAFGANWKLAAKELRTKEFDTWLQRAVPDAVLVEDVGEAILNTSGSDVDAADAKLVTRVCSLFDPEGPLRFKGFAVMPDGMGYALAAAVEKDDKAVISVVSELINKGVAAEWFERKIIMGRSDLTLELKTFKTLQQFVRHAGPGYGVERVLYELNPFLPCRSPILASSYVYSLRDLLPALDKIVEETGKLPRLIDRHVAAFIASRINGSIDTQLADLEHTTGASPTARIGMTGLLAKIQNEYPYQLTPHLTAWLARELEPAISRYHSRTLRAMLKERIEQIAATGNLVELYQTLSSRNVIKRDEKGRNVAKREYAEALREIRRIESVEFQVEAKRTGWKLAAGISLTIGVITTMGVFSW